MTHSSRVVARYLAARTIKLGSIGTYADLDQVGIQPGDHYTITLEESFLKDGTIIDKLGSVHEGLWDYVPDDPDLLDLEDMWKGGVADFGDQRAAEVIQNVPSYPQYIETVRSLVAKSLGHSFTLYRAMPRKQLDGWLKVKPRLQNFSFTSRKQVAVSWSNFAVHSDNDMVVVAGVLTPAAVVMRGKAEEDELVISGMRLKPADLKVVVDKTGSVHEDKIPGGLADKKRPSDFDQAQLAKGMKVEKEHTSDAAIAQEIAMDHLSEDPGYYQKLEKMERTATEKPELWAVIRQRNREVMLSRNNRTPLIFDSKDKAFRALNGFPHPFDLGIVPIGTQGDHKLTHDKRFVTPRWGNILRSMAPGKKRQWTSKRGQKVVLGCTSKGEHYALVDGERLTLDDDFESKFEALIGS